VPDFKPSIPDPVSLATLIVSNVSLHSPCTLDTESQGLDFSISYRSFVIGSYTRYSSLLCARLSSVEGLFSIADSVRACRVFVPGGVREELWVNPRCVFGSFAFSSLRYRSSVRRFLLFSLVRGVCHVSVVGCMSRDRSVCWVAVVDLRIRRQPQNERRLRGSVRIRQITSETCNPTDRVSYRGFTCAIYDPIVSSVVWTNYLAGPANVVYVMRSPFAT